MIDVSEQRIGFVTKNGKRENSFYLQQMKQSNKSKQKQVAIFYTEQKIALLEKQFDLKKKEINYGESLSANWAVKK